MIPEIRRRFNDEFKQEIYNSFLQDVDSSLRYPTDFRVCETPLFVSEEFKNELIIACDDLSTQIQNPDFLKKMDGAIPVDLVVPNENEHTHFFQLDFAMCKDKNGKFFPKLVELQGFPSLYGFQSFINERIRKYFYVPENFSSYFEGLGGESYRKLFREIILSDSAPENVILLEIDPDKQKTKIDFAATENLTGIQSICISDVIKRGSNLYYKKNRKEIPIERIYNRVIFDEFNRTEIDYNFDFRDEIDVEWITHPNWFYKISKYSLPLLTGKYVPACHYLNELESLPENLKNYVLKPLFSFAGHGVEIDISKEMLSSINDPENYIFNNLVRISKGKMMGVDFNKNKTWIGASIAFHP
jgi:hypothetical protein